MFLDLRGASDRPLPPRSLDKMTIAPEASESTLGQAELISFVISNESAWLTGKLVSARWDTVTSLKSRCEQTEQLVETSLLNLRRIDGTLFDETK
jgi:hypothetical protein